MMLTGSGQGVDSHQKTKKQCEYGVETRMWFWCKKFIMDFNPAVTCKSLFRFSIITTDSIYNHTDSLYIFTDASSFPCLMCYL